MLSLSHGLKVQCRVIWALMLREVKTRYGKSKLGYIWALLEPAIMVGVFWTIFSIRGRELHGMSVPIFLLTGAIPWLMFSHIAMRGISAVEGNKALLTYPQVTPLDLILARSLLEAATLSFSFLCLLGLVALAGFPAHINDLGPVLAAFGTLVLLAFGLSTVLASLSRYLPSLEKALGVVMRALFFTSGIFFVVGFFPLWVQDILLFNPVLHVTETIRGGFFAQYTPTRATLAYPLSWAMPLIVVGLLLERHTRRKIDRS